jgi:hypothetical protein
MHLLLQSFREEVKECAGPVLDRTPSAGERIRMTVELGRQAERETNPSGLTFEEKIRRCAALPDNGDEPAGTEKKLDFVTKIRRCAGSPDNDEEMQKALQATDAILRSLAAEAAARPRLKPSTPPPRINATAGKTPLRSFPQGPSWTATSAHARPALPRLRGPGLIRRSLRGAEVTTLVHDLATGLLV